MGPAEVLKFWFEEITPELRFAKNADLDQKIRERFHDVFESAAGLPKLSYSIAHRRPRKLNFCARKARRFSGPLKSILNAGA